MTAGQQLAATQTPHRGSFVAALQAAGRSEPPPCELAFALATEARLAALLTALHRMAPTLTIARLDVLLRGKYGDDLAEITIRHICTAKPRRSIWLDSSSSIEDAVMHVFQGLPDEWFSSSFFVRHVGLERWTAQKLLAVLAERGWLERDGETSGTRYRLATGLQTRADNPGEVSTHDE